MTRLRLFGLLLPVLLIACTSVPLPPEAVASSPPSPSATVPIRQSATVPIPQPATLPIPQSATAANAQSATLATQQPTHPAARAPPAEAPGAGQSSAASHNPSADSPAAQSKPDVAIVETTRRSVRSTAEWLARGVDSWFGDKPFKDGGNVSDGQLSLSWLKRQDEPTDLSLRFNARFQLPNVEQGGYLFIGRDNQREVVTDKPGAFSRQERLLSENASDRSFFAGLGLALYDLFDVRLGVRGALKFYAQARYRKPWVLDDNDLIEFRQTLFWTVDDRFGSSTALSYEHAFSSTLAARWLNATTITRVSKRFEWSSVMGAYKLFGNQRLLSLELLANGEQDTGVDVSDYGVRTKWEQPIYKDWLIGEVLVGHFWPRRDVSSPRGRAWAVGSGLRMKF